MRSITLFIGGMFLLQGCGYSLMSVDQQRQEIREKQAVEERTTHLERARQTIEEQLGRLQTDLKQAREENRKTASDFLKKKADVDGRFDENDLQLRTIQGKLEKQERLLSDLSRQMDNLVFRVNGLSEIKTRLDENRKESELSQKTFQGQVDQIKAQVDQIKTVNTGVAKKLEEQDHRFGAQATQLDTLEKRVGGQVDRTEIEQMNKNLIELSKTLDLLGEKITSKIDEQEKRINTANQRLQTLETKVTPRKKPASLVDGISGRESVILPSERN